MKAVVAGNYSINPTEGLAKHMLTQLAELPTNTTLLLRSPLMGSTGPVEQLAEWLARQIDMPVLWRLPEPGLGREGTIERDFDMVDEADVVIVYFDPRFPMDPERGTTRLVEHAQSTNKPVHAYSAEEQGEPAFVGSLM